MGRKAVGLKPNSPGGGTLPPMPRTPRMLFFSVFEPSGDTLAAALIAEIKARHPDWRCVGFGGPKMEAAGAEILEHTTQHAVMLAGAATKLQEHCERLGRFRAWLSANPIDALIPTDSPAANWSYCKAVRKAQPRARIVHLVAPQVWAWATWRIRKLRRLTDHVLCLLPFEPQWFGERGVPATFVGHPLLAQPAVERAREQLARSSVDWPSAFPRLALLPGSRRGEWKKNWPTMLSAVGELRKRYPGLSTMVAAIDQRAVEALKQIGAEHPTKIVDADYRIAQLDAVLTHADVVLAVSGTVTLDVAAHRTPMVVLYNVGWWSWNLVGRFLVTTRTFTLPNLIGEWDGRGRIVPELVPHFGDVNAVVGAVDALIRDETARRKQRDELERLCSHFEGKLFGKLAADKVIEVLGD